MVMGIVQSKHGVMGSNIPGSSNQCVLTSAPTAGNIIIAYVGCNISKTSVTVNTTYWTVIDAAYDTGTGTLRGMTLGHVVGASESATLPAFWTAGSTWWAWAAHEVSGQYGSTVEDAVLFSVARSYTDSGTSQMPQLPMLKDDNMELSYFGSYNGGTTPSVSGLTLDEAQANNSNYGSIGAAHKNLAATDLSTGTWAGGSSEPLASAMVILRSDNTQGFYPRHVFTTIPNSGVPGSVTVPWTPQVGNLQVLYLGWGNGTTVDPSFTGNWTQFAHADRSGSHTQVFGMYRYVQPGDTAALPAIASGGTGGYSTIQVIEFEDPDGSFVDHLTDSTGQQTSGTTMNTAADVTASDSVLGIIAVVNYNGSQLIAEGVGLTHLQDQHNNGNLGSCALFVSYLPTTGDSLTAALAGLANDATGFIQSQFQLIAPPVSTHTDTYRANLIDGGGTNSGVDVLPGTVYGWHGQIFTKNSVGSPLTRSDFNGMSVQVERTF